MGEQFVAFAGQRHAAWPPLEQAHPELLLEPLDADAERGLGDVKLLRGGEDRPAIGNHHEVAQIA